MASPDPYAALRNRDFRLFLASGFIGIIGNQMQVLALRCDIYERTGHAKDLGWIGLVQAMPILLLALPAGQVADWFDRRLVICVNLVFGAISSVGLYYVSATHGPLWQMYICIVVRSICGVFNQPARQALMPQLLPVSDFPNAITWNSSAFQLALALGPAMGGYVNEVGHRHYGNYSVAYLCDAACLMFSFLAIALVSKQPPRFAREPATLSGLAAGLRFVFSRKVILAALTLDLMATFFGGATTLLPVFAKDILKVGDAELGWLCAAPALGAVAMAVIVAHSPPFKRAGASLLIAVAAFGAATIVFGVSQWYWLSLIALFLTGTFDNISVVVRHTIVQMLAPDAMRGRISAVNSMFIGASNRLSDAESGYTAEWFGPVWSVVVGGIGAIAVVIGTAIFWPELGKVGSLTDLKPEVLEPEPQPTPSASIAGK
jgi:MFS family permease